MKHFLLSFTLGVLPIVLLAQHEHGPERCGTAELHAIKMQDSGYAAAYAEKIDRVKLYQKTHKAEAKMDCDQILYIPVAVHYRGGVGIDMDCAIQMALSQIDSMNLDFSAMNWDVEKWIEGKPIRWPEINNKESCVQFCLASLNHPSGLGLQDGDYAVTLNVYPAGNATIPAWSGYLNFFVEDMDNPLGFSPLGGDGDGDGVTIGLSYFGSVSCGGNNISGTYGFGRTGTHEVGHYLSLSHPFDNPDCTVDGDGIADTPITNASTFGCYPTGSELINCTDPILWPSYMDYVDDACMYMFSEGQVNQMDAYANTSLQNLLNNATTKCQDALCIDFEVNTSKMDETCDGDDGRIAIVAEGGTEPYAFSIDNAITTSAIGIFDDLNSAKYHLYVTDASGCEFIDSLIVGREKPAIELLSSSNAFCGDNSGSLEVRINHSGDFDYKIEGETQFQDATFFGSLTSGVYTVVGSNNVCKNSIIVTISDDTDLMLLTRAVRNVNCPLFDNGLLDLEVANAQPPVTWRLNTDNLTDKGYFENLSPGSYQVTVEESRGCRETFDFNIGISYTNISRDCPCEMYVPNAFTPGYDGVNDLLQVIPSCPITEYHLQVFNRLGTLVFDSLDLNKKWNGDMGDGYFVPADLFFYRITYRWGEERNESLEVQIKQGHITVLR